MKTYSFLNIFKLCSYSSYGYTMLGISFFKYKRLYNLSLIRRKVKESIIFYLRFLQLWPVYYEIFSRDCDCCETTTYIKYPCYLLAYRDMIHCYDNAEGIMYFTAISKKTYLNSVSSTRDRILEAYENGNGNHVIL